MLFQIVKAVRVGFAVRLGDRDTAQGGGGNRKVASAVCFSDSSVLFVERETDCTFGECVAEGVSGGGEGGGVDNLAHIFVV